MRPRHAAALAALAALLLATPGPAAARERSGSLTTARGTWSGSASAGCAGGSCSRSRSLTSPTGQNWSRQGSVSRTGPGDYTGSSTVTGPAGSVTRSTSIDRSW
jgi:hypothetical protein